MEIEYPWVFLALLLTPLPFLIKKKGIAINFSSFSFVPKHRLSAWIDIGLKLMGSIIIGSMVIAFADISLKNQSIKRNYKAREIILILDESASMSTVMKKDGEKRLEIAKKLFIDITDKLPGDFFALVAFGSNALTISPLTQNRDVIKRLIAIQEADLGGTVMELGLLRALNTLKRKSDNLAPKIIIVASDGEGSLRYDDYISDSLKKNDISLYWFNINFQIPATLKGYIKTINNGDIFSINNTPIDTREIIEMVNKKPRGLITETEDGGTRKLWNIFIEIAIFLMTIILFAKTLEIHSSRRMRLAR